MTRCFPSYTDSQEQIKLELDKVYVFKNKQDDSIVLTQKTAGMIIYDCWCLGAIGILFY